MKKEEVLPVERAVEYMEAHLGGRLCLESVAEAVHYSPYHLHRMFARVAGMTVRDYAARRRLTQAAKFLAFSERPILEIALDSGYTSQQAFSAAFKAMYKMPPAQYRARRAYYPLQLRLRLDPDAEERRFGPEDVRPAEAEDLAAWMDLVRGTIDGYPCFDGREYRKYLDRCLAEKRALILKSGENAIGAMMFSYADANIDFIGVHPQYRGQGVFRVLLEKLTREYLPQREIQTTTFREGDRADPGYRREWKRMGFVERERLVEFGYPTQRFVLTVPHGTEHR